MPAPLYNVPADSWIALTAATAKSVLGVKAHANSGILLRKLKIGFDGVTNTAVPALVELCSSTWATNSPGTNSTSVTPQQTLGRVMTVQFTAGKTWTTEPTALTVIDAWPLPVFMGTMFYDLPLGDEYDFDVSTGFVLRVTAPATVNVMPSCSVSRC